MNKENPTNVAANLGANRTGHQERRGNEAASLPQPVGWGRDEILTKEELAAKLKITMRCVERWQCLGHLPYMKVCSIVLFHWPDVLAHLKANYGVCQSGGVLRRGEVKIGNYQSEDFQLGVQRRGEGKKIEDRGMRDGKNGALGTSGSIGKKQQSTHNKK